jgi:hypothetical protein
MNGPLLCTSLSKIIIINIKPEILGIGRGLSNCTSKKEDWSYSEACINMVNAVLLIYGFDPYYIIIVS